MEKKSTRQIFNLNKAISILLWINDRSDINEMVKR